MSITKHIPFVFLLGCFASLKSQQPVSKQPATLGVDFIMNDYGRNALADKAKYGRLDKMIPGIAVHYTQGLSNRYSWNLMLSGSFSDSMVKADLPAGKKLMIEGALQLYRKFSDHPSRLEPFVSGGIGGVNYQNYYSVFVPVGTGLQWNVHNGIYALFNAQYRFATTPRFANQLFYSIGIAGAVGHQNKKKIKSAAPGPQRPAFIAENPEPQPVDSDHDGIVDIHDDCPDVPGFGPMRGCPDKDRDGIRDKDDQCPDVYGIAELNGCPAADPPGKEADMEEKEPLIASTAKEDNRLGMEDSLANKLSYLARHILFETNSSKLKSASFTALDEAAAILRKTPHSSIQIEGHTDNQGSAFWNQTLSVKRANEVKAYLVAKGIDKNKLNAAGYGFSRPIDNNNTEAGRSRNRRVELKIQ